MTASERLRHQHRLTQQATISKTTFDNWFRDLNALRGELYWTIYYEAKRRGAIKKEAWAEAERVYKLYWKVSRYPTYPAMSMAKRKRKENGYSDSGS